MNWEEEKHQILVASDYDAEHLRKVVKAGWKAVRKLARIVIPDHPHDFDEQYPANVLYWEIVEHVNGVGLMGLLPADMYGHRICLEEWLKTLPAKTRKLFRELSDSFDRKISDETLTLCRNVCSYALESLSEEEFAERVLGHSLSTSEAGIVTNLPELYGSYCSSRNIPNCVINKNPRDWLVQRLALATEGIEQREQVFYELVAREVEEGLSRLVQLGYLAAAQEKLDWESAEWLNEHLCAGYLRSCSRSTANGIVWDIVMIPKGMLWHTETNGKVSRMMDNHTSLARGLLAPTVFAFIRNLPPWKGQLISHKETATDGSLFFPAWYYNHYFKITPETLRQAKRDIINPIRTKKSGKDNIYYYPDIQRRYPGTLSPDPPPRIPRPHSSRHKKKTKSNA